MLTTCLPRSFTTARSQKQTDHDLADQVTPPTIRIAAGTPTALHAAGTLTTTSVKLNITTIITTTMIPITTNLSLSPTRPRTDRSGRNLPGPRWETRSTPSLTVSRKLSAEQRSA